VNSCGIAMGRSPLTSGLESAGALARPFPSLEVGAGTYCLVTPVNGVLRGAKRRVVDWLRAEAAKEG
jgi:hypothetical protein